MIEHNHKTTCEIIRSFLFGLTINVSLWFIWRRGRNLLFTFPMKNVNARIQIILKYSMTLWILHYIKIIIYIFFSISLHFICRFWISRSCRLSTSQQFTSEFHCRPYSSQYALCCYYWLCVHRFVWKSATDDRREKEMKNEDRNETKQKIPFSCCYLIECTSKPMTNSSNKMHNLHEIPWNYCHGNCLIESSHNIFNVIHVESITWCHTRTM